MENVLEQILEEIKALKIEISNLNSSRKGKTLSIKETVEYFDGKISEWKLRDYVNNNEIPYFRLGGRDILFDTKELDLWWHNKQIESLQPKLSIEDKYLNTFGIKKIPV